MKTYVSLLLVLIAFSNLHAALPIDEAGAITYLSGKGVKFTKSADGRTTRLMSSGKELLTTEEYALIGRITSLEQIGINGAPLAEGEWGFLKTLPNLKQLAVWHCPGFATLEPFSGLPVESLTIGGCMGLRDKNKNDPDQLRHAIKTLHDLPNLKKGNWYHSPLAPDDSHLAHVAQQFPKLEELRLDFASTRGSQTSITSVGLTTLHKLPLNILGLENAHSFTVEHFQAIAGIKSLKMLTVDARNQPAPMEGIAAFKQARPDVQVAVSMEGDNGPPQVRKR